ncbi:MAG: SAM-dependent methyltransferase, partial [Sphingomicrobium sp.]
MAMIDTLVGKLIRKGRLTVAFPYGSERGFGPGGGPSLKVRLADRKVAFDIARNPRVGVGEAFMDGRLTVEGGDILDLLRLVVG